MSIKTVNGTSHTINIYRVEDTVKSGRKLILKPGSQPLIVIPAGKDLNCQATNLPAPSMNTEIPLKGAVVFTGYDPIPEADLVIVSNLYHSAVKELGGDTSTLATVSGTVYQDEESLRPCGCLELAVG